MMEFAASCDIVRNNNPKSKRFGQYGIVLTTSAMACSYVNYQDGFTAYCAMKHFTPVKHIKITERIGGEAIYKRGNRGRLKLVDANNNERTLSREAMWVLAQKYIHRTAVVV